LTLFRNMALIKLPFFFSFFLTIRTNPKVCSKSTFRDGEI
jgi:hypothetical protein